MPKWRYSGHKASEFLEGKADQFNFQLTAENFNALCWLRFSHTRGIYRNIDLLLAIWRGGRCFVFVFFFFPGGVSGFRAVVSV